MPREVYAASARCDSYLVIRTRVHALLVREPCARPPDTRPSLARMTSKIGHSSSHLQLGVAGDPTNSRQCKFVCPGCDRPYASIDTIFWIALKTLTRGMTPVSRVVGVLELSPSCMRARGGGPLPTETKRPHVQLPQMPTQPFFAGLPTHERSIPLQAPLEIAPAAPGRHVPRLNSAGAGRNCGESAGCCQGAHRPCHRLMR
jgi:hypothetical protein